MTYFSTNRKTPGEQAVAGERVSTKARERSLLSCRSCVLCSGRASSCTDCAWSKSHMQRQQRAGEILISSRVSPSFQVLITQNKRNQWGDAGDSQTLEKEEGNCPTGPLETREGRKKQREIPCEHFFHKLTSSPHPCIQGLVSLTPPSGTGHCT